MQKQKGFTLIELVVMIVILGVLAAVALPRFMDATDDAHTSAVQGTGGALAAGVALVRSQWELNRVKGGATPNVNVTGFGADDVDVNDSGWPVANDGLALATAPTAAQCVQVWTSVLQGSAPSVGTTGTVDYVATAAPADSCTFTYRLDGRVAANGADADATNDVATRAIVYNAATGAVTTKAD